jgi:hypothetical protein
MSKLALTYVMDIYNRKKGIYVKASFDITSNHCMIPNDAIAYQKS